MYFDVNMCMYIYIYIRTHTHIYLYIYLWRHVWTIYNPHVQCIDPGVERWPDVTFGSSKIELRSSIVCFHGSTWAWWVRRHADYELRQRDHRRSKSRCIVSNSSDGEEEERSRAASSAAGSELGAAGCRPSRDSRRKERERRRKGKEGSSRAQRSPKDKRDQRKP